jgi:hypothetical protein
MGGTGAEADESRKKTDVMLAPPDIASRVDQTVYLHKGVERMWSARDRTFLCMCKAPGTCGGGKQLNRCKNSLNKKAPVNGGHDVQTQPVELAPVQVEVEATRSDAQKSSWGETGGLRAQEFAAINKYKCCIETTKKSGKIWVLENGRWDQTLKTMPLWTRLRAGGAGHRFPLRIGLEYVKEFGTSDASRAINRDNVRIHFTVMLNTSTPDRPAFSARDYDGGPFAKRVTGSSPSEVEIAWMTQGGQSLSKADSKGSRFLGLDSVGLQDYLIECTHGFSETCESHTRTAYKQVCVTHVACVRACLRVHALAGGCVFILSQPGDSLLCY